MAERTKGDTTTTTPLPKYKKEIIVVAKQLCYHSSVFARIENASSEREIDRIMREYRFR